MKNLHLTVAAIIEDQGRFLVVEEYAGGKLVINQPAGHVEPGEAIVTAAIRETLEETAWQFAPEAITGIYLWEAPNGEPFLRIAFCGQHSNHNTAIELDDGIVRTLWLSREELVKRREQLRSPMVLRGIDDYLAGTRLPLDVVSHINTEALIERASPVA